MMVLFICIVSMPMTFMRMAMSFFFFFNFIFFNTIKIIQNTIDLVINPFYFILTFFSFIMAMAMTWTGTMKLFYIFYLVNNRIWSVVTMSMTIFTFSTHRTVCV